MKKLFKKKYFRQFSATEIQPTVFIGPGAAICRWLKCGGVWASHFWGKTSLELESAKTKKHLT
jgi:hypothetical protein